MEGGPWGAGRGCAPKSGTSGHSDLDAPTPRGPLPVHMSMERVEAQSSGVLPGLILPGPTKTGGLTGRPPGGTGWGLSPLGLMVTLWVGGGGGRTGVQGSRRFPFSSGSSVPGGSRRAGLRLPAAVPVPAVEPARGLPPQSLGSKAGGLPELSSCCPPGRHPLPARGLLLCRGPCPRVSSGAEGPSLSPCLPEPSRTTGAAAWGGICPPQVHPPAGPDTLGRSGLGAVSPPELHEVGVTAPHLMAAL